MKLRVFALLAALAAMAAVVSVAFAARPGAGSCSGGSIQPGTYNGFMVTGTCFFAGGTVTINGNLVVAAGASLNPHAATYADVHVTGNVLVGKDGTLGLGKYGPPNIPLTGTVVDGNIVANQPQTLYLSAITVHGNLVSNGGSSTGLNFPIKNNVIGGNIEIQGWSGLWIGLFRNTVTGNVIFSKNTGVQTGDTGELDSSEVANNIIGGNLICQGNMPAAQFGDSGGTANTVSGQAIGQCSTLAG
jgi:hypothetical protein